MQLTLNYPDKLQPGLLRWKNRLNVGNNLDLTLEEWMVQHFADLALDEEMQAANNQVQVALNEITTAEFRKARTAVLVDAGVPALPVAAASEIINP